MQLRSSGHLMRMDDERLPKQLFYGDVATGSRRQGGQIRRYKDTLKSTLKRLQINPTNWVELALDRPTWRRTVKTGAAISEANRIAAAKVKREARKSQLRPVRNADPQPLPTCPPCRRAFRARIGFVGHLRINCAPRTAPTIVPPPASSSSSLLLTESDSSSEPPLPSSSSSSSSSSSTTTPTTAAQAAVSHITNPDTTTDNTPTASDSSDEDQDYTCPHCDRTFTSHIGLVGHSRIHRTETDEPVPGAPTYTHRTRLQCPHCPRTLTHRMGLVGHMRIHESGIDRITDSSSMSNPTPLHHPAPPPPLPQLIPTPPTSPAHTVHAHSPLASAWSVTCESLAQRLRNQCLEHQPIPTKLVSAAHTVLALSGIAWAHSATCASTTTCGRQPPAASHHHTPPSPIHHHLSPLTHRKYPPATSHASGKCASRLGPHAAPAARVS
ncbi:hypothetical protein SprV_0501994400 [Sparganum proliferum]